MWTNTLLPIQTHKPKKHTTHQNPSPLFVSIVSLLSLLFPLFPFFIRCTRHPPRLGYCLLFALLRYSSSTTTTTTIAIISAITLPFYCSWSFSLFCSFVFFFFFFPFLFSSPPGPALVSQIQSPLFDAVFVRNVLVRGRCCCCRKRRRRRRRKNAQVERYIYGGIFFAQRCKERAALLSSLLLFFFFFFVGSQFSMQKESIVAVVSGV